MDTEKRLWVKPSVVAERLDVSLEKVARLPLTKIDVRNVGAQRPQWRYQWESVLKLEQNRTGQVVSVA